MPPIISIESLGKKYTLRHQSGGNGYRRFSEELVNAFKRPFRGLWKAADQSASGNTREDFWALRDVSFKVQQGEVIGIIGRNGAGKSTLLKILSRITEPSEGRVRLRGRVASLLEVGTGFHPELTGRENVYLNGAILGMSRAEIRRKFDEIVAFAEVEKFLDTPVKHYSSGMYVRLAFAVAAHLEPEILIVDEVLAVGDAGFQKKCLGKMGEVANEGRTILLVSHNMAVIASLCSRAVLLEQGRYSFEGAASDVVAHYIALGREESGERVWEHLEEAPGDDHIRLRAVRTISGGQTVNSVPISEDFQIELEFWNLCEGALVTPSIHLLDCMGVPVLATANLPSASLGRDSWFGRPYPLGLYRATCTIPGNFLNEGRYSIHAICLSDLTRFHVFERDVLAFNVYETGEMREEYLGPWQGVVRPKLAWMTSKIDSFKADV